jgi:hypothetical protein
VVDVREEGAMMSPIIPRGRGRGYLGAIIDGNTAENLYSTYMDPLFASYNIFIQDVRNASVFIDKTATYAALDALSSHYQQLADRLKSLDASDVSTWKADAIDAQAKLNQFTNDFAVYNNEANRRALYSAFVGTGLGALTGWLVYRRKKSRKWAIFAGSGAAAATGTTSWYLMRPELP